MWDICHNMHGMVVRSGHPFVEHRGWQSQSSSDPKCVGQTPILSTRPGVAASYQDHGGNASDPICCTHQLHKPLQKHRAATNGATRTTEAVGAMHLRNMWGTHLRVTADATQHARRLPSRHSEREPTWPTSWLSIAWDGARCACAATRPLHIYMFSLNRSPSCNARRFASPSSDTCGRARATPDKDSHFLASCLTSQS